MAVCQEICYCVCSSFPNIISNSVAKLLCQFNAFRSHNNSTCHYLMHFDSKSSFCSTSTWGERYVFSNQLVKTNKESYVRSLLINWIENGNVYKVPWDILRLWAIELFLEKWMSQKDNAFWRWTTHTGTVISYCCETKEACNPLGLMSLGVKKMCVQRRVEFTHHKLSEKACEK